MDLWVGGGRIGGAAEVKGAGNYAGATTRRGGLVAVLKKQR